MNQNFKSGIVRTNKAARKIKAFNKQCSQENRCTLHQVILRWQVQLLVSLGNRVLYVIPIKTIFVTHRRSVGTHSGATLPNVFVAFFLQIGTIQRKIDKIFS
ncbi:hypothetical protein A6S26_06395 [Nostoc sp. ATCC 43529]|nr:hypothetical protein A6S26_06395 [Nostoc sp. ATCC 43529]